MNFVNMKILNHILWFLILFAFTKLIDFDKDPISQINETTLPDSTQIILPVSVIMGGKRVTEKGFLDLLAKNQELRNQFFRNPNKK